MRVSVCIVVKTAADYSTRRTGKSRFPPEEDTALCRKQKGMQGPVHNSLSLLEESPKPVSPACVLRGAFFLMLLGLSGGAAAKAALWPHLLFWQSEALTVSGGSLLATAIAAVGLRITARLEQARQRTEQGLREREEQYRMVFENAAHGIYRTTPDGRILLANPALLEMLGFETFESLAARNLETEGTEADYERSEFRRQIETTGRVRGLEAVWARRDGSKIYVRENAQLVRGPNSEPLFYEGSVEDITQLRMVQEALQRSHAQLEQRVEHRTREVIGLNAELTSAYDATIEGWSRALDMRDKETEGHCRRVTDLTLALAQAMNLPSADLMQVRRGALLHDIGKMGIPDAILLKPGPLDDGEWEIMRRHPVYAYDMLSPITFLRPALAIPLCHHEKWDGTGYPHGLWGEEIPLSARLFAVVDVWDALRSDRPYRAGWPTDKVRAHIAGGAGTHFDPQVVEAFLALTADAAPVHAKKWERRAA